MPYNYVADSIHTNKLCSRLSLSELQFNTENGRFAFFEPTLGVLHLRLTEKRVVDFMLVLTERFSAEALRANID